MLILREFLAKFYEALIILLLALLGVLTLFLASSLIANSLYKKDVAYWKSQAETLIEQNKTASLTAEVMRLNKEKEWADTVKAATEVYHGKITKLEADNLLATDNANRLSEELTEANKRLANAPRAALVDYTNTANDVLRSCVEEYRGMAELAQKHAIDAQRFRESCPAP